MDFSNAKISSNTTTGSMQIYGLGSGIDTQAIINAQLQAMRLKIDPNYTLQDNYAGKKSIWDSLKTQLTSLKTLADGIKDISSINQTTSYSKDGYVKVTAKGDSVGGNYNLSIQKIALANKVMSDGLASSTAPIGQDGTLNINGKNVQVTSSMTLNDVAKAINTADVGADATVVSGHLFLTSQKTGASSIINITATNDSKGATVSDNNALGVTITGDTSGLNSSYSIEVQQLAAKQKVESTPYLNQTTNMNYSGSFIINGQTINIDTTMKMSDIVNQINNNSNTGVTASIVNNKLTLESKNSGAANSFSIIDNTTSIDRPEGLFEYLGMTDSADNFTGTSLVTNAQDAQYTIDGASYTSATNNSNVLNGLDVQLKAVTTAPVSLTISNTGGDIATNLGLITGTGTIKNQLQAGQNAEYTIEGVSGTSESNIVTDAVSDMTFELVKETTEDIQITVSEDKDALVDKMKKFVDTYNSVMQNINGLTQKEGSLQGESLAKDAKNTLRSVLFDSSNNMMMYQIGIEGNGLAKDGTIKFDETKFKKALDDNYDNVMGFLSGSSGIAKIFSDKVNEYTKTDGNIDNKTDNIQKNIDRIQDIIDRQEAQFEKQQASLVDKYSKFESLMAQMNARLQMMKAQLNAGNDKDS